MLSILFSHDTIVHGKIGELRLLNTADLSYRRPIEISNFHTFMDFMDFFSYITVEKYYHNVIIYLLFSK